MSKIECINPFSGESTGIYAQESINEVANKVKILNESQRAWNRESIEKRIELVRESLSYFSLNEDQIALDICEQMGRPLHQSKGEIAGMLGRAQHLTSIAKDTLSPDIYTDQEGFERSIEHVALGTIFVISAWNYPLLITINSIIPALLAGNTVLLKHSSLTPKLGKHFENAFSKLGDHTDLVKSIIVDHDVTGKIIETQNIQHVIFTGSVKGGRSILGHTSKRFMTPGLELGGKDAVYIHSDADLTNAIETVVDGAMFNSGQSCCGTERAYIHEDLYEEFVEQATALVSKYNLGDPKDRSTNLGPLANAKSANFMQEQVEEALKLGANLVVGGRVEKINKGTFFAPTLITEVNHSMDIMKEENFGPILPVMKVSGLNEAIKLVNDSDYGLTSAIFTSSKEVAQVFAEEVNTGTVFMNRCDYLDPALPWTGVKNSGCGSSLSKYGFHAVTRKKSLHFKIKL